MTLNAPANAPSGSSQVDLDAVTTLADLASVLRHLRRREARNRQGRELTYRQIAQRTGWSIGIVAGYLTGTAMPPTDRFDVLVLLLGATPDEVGPLATARDRVADARQRPERPEVTSVAEWPVPHELPAPPSDFVGREHHLSRLDEYLDASPARVPFAVVTGMAGVGKTALTLRWAHSALATFPDGQLYVDLRGYDPTEPVDPADALARFLHSLGVSSERVPLDLAERAARYRTLVAKRRMLIVLDNALSADQVRPLLPGSPLCTVVVTSRDSLAGLVSAEGAQRVHLDVLSTSESAVLLRSLIGDRVDDSPDAAGQLASYCGQLPLAIRVASDIAAHRHHVPLSELVEDLRNERTRLDVLDTGDVRTAVRSVLSWSYRTLTPGAARLFRLLGTGPGPDLPTAAVASLGRLDLGDTRRLLTELTRAHMLTETRPGRYGFHDVLRAYAAELAHNEGETSQAVRRLLDHYLGMAVAADRQLEPNRLPIDLVSPTDGVVLDRIDSLESAQTWFDDERPTLLAAIGLAAEFGYGEHVWQLPWAMADDLDRAGYWQELAAANALALEGTTDPVAQSRIRHSLARVAYRLGLIDTALEHYAHALEHLEELGDQHGQALAHTNLAGLYGETGRLRDAVRHCQQALAMFRSMGDTMGQALALNNLGYTQALLGEYAEAMQSCHEALALLQELDDRPTQGFAWDSLGYIHDHLGDLDEAIRCYRNAFAVHQESGDRYQQSIALTHLGDTFATAGQPDEARAAWKSSLAILEDLDHPDMDGLRSRLAN
jgi:tetratricopeptide (TPR) repeat protein/transcriptional regulator with XRE-family HTH domain